MTPDKYCQQKALQSGSSFYYSFLFLPPERRRAITALYAFCRAVDDIVDEALEIDIARTQLAWWRQEISAMFDGQPQHPVTRAMHPHVAAYGLPADYFYAIIDGMELDLQQARYLDFNSLQNYCWHVASAVGLLSAHIFGHHPSTQTLEFAEKLGLACQLTNIIRDVGADSRKGRIYLPVNDLQQFNVSADDMLHRRYSDNFRQLMHFQARRARQIYDAAYALLPATERKAQRPSLIMATIYRTLLDEIERDGFQVLHQRIALTPIRKFWLAWKTYIRN